MPTDDKELWKPPVDKVDLVGIGIPKRVSVKVRFTAIFSAWKKIKELFRKKP